METDPVEKKHPDKAPLDKKAATNGMKDAKDVKDEAGDAAPKDPDLLTLEDIREQVRYIEKAVSTKEHHYLTRVVRSVVRIRRKLNSNVLLRLIHGYLPRPSPLKDSFLKYLPESMDTDTPTSPFRPRSGKNATTPLLPEVEVFLHLLLLIYLIDKNKYDEAVKCSKVLMDQVCSHNRRSLDMLAARCYFYHARAHELTNTLQDLRPFFHARLRTCTLRNDFEGQATLVNLLLRNYLQYQLHEQADKLASKVTFPDQAPNSEWARFFYYLGRIKAIQLEYSVAQQHLTAALRKAPQHVGVGFKQTVHKLHIVVQLLLGEVPDRAVFRQDIYKNALAPYFQLTQAIRGGHLDTFNEVLRQYGKKFIVDETYTLIVRLRHNVIKTGVRQISLSYSRISLADIAHKLQLDSPEDAEYIVAKAVRDGVIEAVINHEEGYMQSKEKVDVYMTGEPLAQYHQRVRFCLDIRNQSVKAMRYPPKSYSKDLETAEERREREQQELETAKEMSEDDYDGFP